VLFGPWTVVPAFFQVYVNGPSAAVVLNVTLSPRIW